MVFPIASIPIKRKVKPRQSLQLCVLLTTAIGLSACGAQDNASAQNDKNRSVQSVTSAKNANGSVSAGQIVFERANCAMCHPGGNNTMDPGHPIKGPDFSRKYGDDLILEATIRKGFPDVGMPAFSKKVIDEHEMKDLIAYVRTLTSPVKTTAEPKK